MNENLGRYKKKEIISLLKTALEKVDRGYVFSENPSVNDIYIERVFAYELYHQMRLVFPDDHGSINGEYRKYLKIVPTMKNNQEYNKKIYIPDIVVHQPSNLYKNILAIEIKTSPDLKWDDLDKDLKKLEFYTKPDLSEGLGFEIGVMLIVNYDIKEIMPEEKKCDLKKFLKKYPRIAIWTLSFRREDNGRYVPVIEIIKSNSDLSPR